MNIILNTDSYKASHAVQYPEGTTKVFSYIESRGHEHDKHPWDRDHVEETVFFGLQIFIKEYLSKPITKEDIDEAEQFFLAHGEPFYRAKWEYILEKHNGFLPVKIKAVPEGTVVPTKNVLVTVENTDPECFWLTSYLETTLLRAVWYPTTVATNSREIKKIIKEYLVLTSDNLSGIDFKLHDFGARGVSSNESAMIGGVANLVNFMGSDTVMGVVAASRYYGEKMAAYSIPAAEHSTITSWGKDREAYAYLNMIDQFGQPGKLFAVVSDSYDIYNAVKNIWGAQLKDKVLASGAKLIVRPDSGDPIEVVLRVVEALGESFGYSINTKGYKVLHPSVGVIQGDGINKNSIRNILNNLAIHGWSTDNVAFGMGGALLQQLNRDTFKFAMKCSAIEVNGVWRDVYKSPITDPVKVSKAGRITLVKDDFGNFRTVRESSVGDQIKMLTTVFENGKIIKEWKFSEIREKAKV